MTAAPPKDLSLIEKLVAEKNTLPRNVFWEGAIDRAVAIVRQHQQPGEFAEASQNARCEIQQLRKEIDKWHSAAMRAGVIAHADGSLGFPKREAGADWLKGPFDTIAVNEALQLEFNNMVPPDEVWFTNNRGHIVGKIKHVGLSNQIEGYK